MRLLAYACLVLPVPAQEAPTVLREVVQVVDGDTIHVERDGVIEKLRLLSVDTEEKIAGRPSSSALKPETVFGEETALWAREFFADLAEDGRPARVGLRFPPNGEQRDVYGRLLCHVILPDGRDFNLLLVEQGWSPYFNKYGNSLLRHEDFVRAQKKARKERLGIWNPSTNRAATPGAPEVLRPYDQLLPWWQARAEAVEEFRRRAGTEHVIAADDPAALRTALAADEIGVAVVVFGAIDRFFEEPDGSLTARFRGDRQLTLRASLSAVARGGALERMLRRSREELRQNYLFLEGGLTQGRRGPVIVAGDPDAWELAGPEPDLPR